MAKILFVMTGADHWTLADGTRHPTGFWAEEATAPHRVFTEAGHQVTVATPGGVQPPVDQSSLTAEANGGQQAANTVTEALDTFTALREPVALENVELADYDAVFYPGGHGPMEDLSGNAYSARLLTRALETGTPLGVVCHAPAALLATAGADGGSPFSRFRLTGFSNAEEQQVGLADQAPWLLQDRLVALGADYREGEPWEAHVVVDGTLHTGQNPASAAPLAEGMLDVLG